MASLRLLDQFKNVRCSSTPSKRLRLKLGFKTSTSVGISRCKVRKLTDEFTRIKSASILGKGGFSTVKLVYRKEGNKREYYAVKVLDKPDNEPDETYVARALAEFDIGRNLCHTNIIKTLDLCRKGDKLCFVMEYCKHGDLCGLMDRRYLTYGDAKCLFKQLLRGIAYMHSRGIAHHDIKPENLLLADDGTLKIIDFGLSVVFADLLPANDRGERKLSKCRLCGPRLCGTTSFLPPEVLRLKGNYDPRTVDVWSCAITFYALFTRYMPWGEADTTRDDAFAEFQARWEEYLEKCPDTPIVETCIPRCFGFFNRLPTSNGLRVLLARMLHPFSEKRITIFEALKDPWVERIECCSPEMNYLSSIRAAGDIIIPNVHDHLSKIRHSFSY